MNLSNKKITITVITPSFNQGQFIEKTIESVLSQEGDFFIDYIIADGGSSDDSVEIIKKYDELLKNKKYPIKCRGIEYRWWSRKDRGQSEAINQGFKIAKGDILAWLNSDDFYEPGVFAYILERFKDDPDADLIYGDSYILIQGTGKKILMRSKQGNFEALLQENCPVYQPSAFFTKNIIQKIGFLDENLHYPMDYDLWLRISRNGKILYCPGKALSVFRVWDEAKTSPQKEKILFRRKTSKQHRNNILESNRIYSFEGKIKDFEYLLKKYKKWLERYPSAYAVKLRHLGTMHLLVNNRKKSIKYFVQSVKVNPTIRNILTMILSLSGKKVYYLALNLKRKFTKNLIC